MTDSTNPRVMADNIKELSASSGSQAVDISTLQGDVETLGDAIEALGSYSTTEVNTGMKYGNKDIYRKILTGTMPADIEDSYKSIYISLSADIILNIIGIVNFGSYYALMPYVNDSGKFIKAYYNSSGESITVSSNGSSFSSAPVTIIVEYTKPDPTPTPDVLPSPDSDTRALEEPETEPEPESEPIEEKK